ncbi:CC0125/CC1285 family lipoprotein [Qipengyuania zhejiangensis]|uniref:CC0125/CC1285 family lipoprotein n=1 Tax=Qipengyuania zhejiangensis TaxID=3077782 RepID=UPI002D78C0E0|nr:hypothetical protein [Qipengyuania sp. Z2]
MISLRKFTAAAALAVSVAGCAHPTPYQPQSASAGMSRGYSDERLAEGRYRVSFSGNYLTSRETVEAYLLYRAAELTVEQGYDWFSVIDRETSHKVRREIRRDPLYTPWHGSYYGYWLPYWRYNVRGRGWYVWDPYHADPFWADRFDEREIEEFEATVEIRMGRGTAPSGNGHVYVARKVLEDIGPRVVRDYSRKD